MGPYECPITLALLGALAAGCGASESPRDVGRSAKADAPYTGHGCYDRTGRGEPWKDYSMHRCVDTQQPGFAGSECDGQTVKGYCHGGSNILCCVLPAPRCNNGKLEGTEECDGGALGGQTCQTLGYAAGALACDAQCKLDTSACTNAQAGGAFGDRCGGPDGECPPGMLCVIASSSGEDKGFCTQPCSASLPCPSSPPAAECILQLSSGEKVCGFRCNPQAPGSQCPGEMACTETGSGHLCTTDDPAVCGNDKIEGGEQCDGTQLNNLSCRSFGFSGGALGCDSDCAYDKSGCQGSTTCDLPPLHCTAGNAACGELELLSPAQGDGYLMGHPPAWSWGRHDVLMTIKHAAAAVACLMPGSLPIHTFDVSMQDGSVPKSDAYGNPCNPLSASCQLRHPQGTHTGGNDIDMSYFQTQGMANPGPVCPHLIDGKEAYHCVGAPTILDAPRTALYLGKLLESSRIRVIGVDGKIGPLVEAEAQKLLQQGLISAAAYSKFNRLAYEATDTGRGWFLHHHHHFHVSQITSPYPSLMMPDDGGDWIEVAPDPDEKPNRLSILDPSLCAEARCPSTVPLLDLDRRYRRPREVPMITVRRLNERP